MFRRKALRKLLITSILIYALLTLYSLPKTTNQKNEIQTSLKINDITNINTDTIYLVNKNNFLVKKNIFIDTNILKNKIEIIIENLKLKTDNNELKGYIPQKTKLLNYKIEDDHLILNFSKEIKNVSNEKQLITGITYSFLELENINYVSFLIEKIPWNNYTKLSKSIGINNEYILNGTKDNKKIVVYYLDNTNNYYVPVTRYLNDKREKIEIIVDELKKTKKNLISYIPEKIKLLDYKEQENVMFLNFNEYLKDSCEDSKEKIIKTISYSVFDNYDVNMVMFEVDNKKYQYIYKNKNY